MPDSPGHPSPPEVAGSLAGRILDGRYRIERLLGRGGMSEVYLGHHLALDRPCAVKVLPPDRTGDPDAVTRFQREASAASRIAHPNVCRVHDFGVTAEGVRYLVMEYLDGQPLSALLAGGPLDLPRALRLAVQCAAGLQAAHDAGIVHRDLKPENVIVTGSDDHETAVLVDFGIARPLTGGTLTRDGLLVGTPEVMSPEQIAGDPVGPASDQYQLALLLVRMVTGQWPFRGETTQERMTSRLVVAPARMTELAPELAAPAGLQAVVDRALARRPGERFPNVRSVAAALEALPVFDPGAATEVLPPLQISRSRLASRRVAWIAAGLIVLAGGIAVWLQTHDTPAVPAGARDTLPETTAVGGPPPSPPAAPPPSPAPSPASPPTIPPLPSEDLVFSDDPGVRLGAREAAERVYRSGAADSLRATAAYLIAETHRRDSAYAEARVWLQHCLVLQERALCRQLLSILP